MDRLIGINSELEEDERQLPSNLKEMIDKAVEFLGEVPPMSLGVRLSIWRSRMAHHLIMFFIYPLHTFWITLIWQTLRPPTVLKTVQYLNIPKRRRLNLRKVQVESLFLTTLTPI